MTWADRVLIGVAVLLLLGIVIGVRRPTGDGVCHHRPRWRPWSTSCDCLYVYRLPRGGRVRIDGVEFTNECPRAVLLTHDRRRRPRPRADQWR